MPSPRLASYVTAAIAGAAGLFALLHDRIAPPVVPGLHRVEAMISPRPALDPTGLELLLAPPPVPAQSVPEPGATLPEAPATVAEAIATPMPDAIVVDSRAADDTYPIWLWTPSEAATVGRIDHRETRDEVVTLSGWAGDVMLGLRMSHVLLVACSRVIATVPVAEERPDILARHPNLAPAGWTARLALADLVPCADPSITAYGVSRYGNAAFPIEGAVPAPAGAGVLTTSTTLFARPESMERTPETARAPVRVVEIGDEGITLRRCGRRACAVVGRLPAGKQQLLILDNQAGWLLVAKAGGSAGWTPDTTLPGAVNSN